MAPRDEVKPLQWMSRGSSQNGERNMNHEAIRLAHITTVPDTLGFLTGQVGYLKAQGFDVSAISSPGDLLSQFGESEQVAVHAVEMPRRIAPLRDVAALFAMWKVLRRTRPHIVHAHTPKGGLLGMVGAWLARVPVRIYHVHGLPFITATGWKRRLLVWTEFVSCTFAHRVLCVSSSVRQVAVNTRLCRPEKITVLARGSVNGVDARQQFNGDRLRNLDRESTRRGLHIPPQATVLGYVGRIVRDKGIVELARAWDELRHEFPLLHLLLVGPQEAEDPISIEVECTLRSDPRVHLVGRQNDTPPLYAVMDLLALPTHREGFGTVLLEAAAMKLPVVATRIPGCVDAVQDGITGTLVPPQNSAALAESVRRYLHDAHLRASHGAAARERALRDFSPETLWRAVHQEYMQWLSTNEVTPQGEERSAGSDTKADEPREAA